MSTICGVVGCELRATTTLDNHQREQYGRTAGVPVCDEHNFAIAQGAPYAYMPRHGGILIGEALVRAGLLVVDDAFFESHVDTYISGVDSLGPLVISGRIYGSGEPRSVEILLTEQAADQIGSAIDLTRRRRAQ